MDLIIPSTGLLSTKAAFTKRTGGVSSSPYDALNLGLSTKDHPDNVLQNRRLVAERLGFDLSSLAIAGQVHGSEVLTVSAGGLFPGFDALVTDQAGVLLCISAADCAAVLFWDNETGVLGACHAGWRGCVGGVIQNTVSAMRALGAVEAGIRAYVSPCLSLESFEVGEEVAAQFESQSFEASRVVRKQEWQRPHVDLPGAIKDQLRTAGISGDRMEVSGRCTLIERDVFFSHRGHDGATGRMMGMIGRTE